MIPALHDDVVILNQYTDEDLEAHLAGEDEETARRFGWWPKTSTPATVRDAFARWAHDWETGGPVRAFATREQATGRLVGGCELRIKPGGPANVSYWTNAADRGRGHATRSLALLLDYARSIGIRDAEARHRRRQPPVPPGRGESRVPSGRHLHRGRRHWHDQVPDPPDKFLGRAKDQPRPIRRASRGGELDYHGRSEVPFAARMLTKNYASRQMPHCV